MAEITLNNETPIEVKLTGPEDLLKIIAPANGVGGYEWYLRTPDSHVLVRSVYNGRDPYEGLPVEEMPIGGGIDRIFELFVFADATVRLERRRPWIIRHEPIRAIDLTITVGEAPAPQIDTRDPFDLIGD